MSEMRPQIQWQIDQYRHLRPPPAVNAYRLVRDAMGITQAEAARRIGINRQAWQYRERRKWLYWPVEIVALQQMSGFSDEEMMGILRRCAHL
jgi:hypothetical protein